MVIRGERRSYLQHHPGPRDVALVVEVSDTTLNQDRTLKKRIYAAAGIAVYWILNLSERKLEVYTDPTGPGLEPDYRSRTDVDATGQARLLLEGREVATLDLKDLLP